MSEDFYKFFYNQNEGLMGIQLLVDSIIVRQKLLRLSPILLTNVPTPLGVIPLIYQFTEGSVEAEQATGIVQAFLNGNNLRPRVFCFKRFFPREDYPMLGEIRADVLFTKKDRLVQEIKVLKSALEITNNGTCYHGELVLKAWVHPLVKPWWYVMDGQGSVRWFEEDDFPGLLNWDN